MPGGSNFWPYGYGVTPNSNGIVNYTQPVGPFLPSDANDYSTEFGPVAFVQSSVSKLSANVSRLFESNKTVIDQGSKPAWYDVFGRISAGASAVNEAFQSTLIKVIVLVAIVGIVAVFGLSYVQAKGNNLAK